MRKTNNCVLEEFKPDEQLTVATLSSWMGEDAMRIWVVREEYALRNFM